MHCLAYIDNNRIIDEKSIEEDYQDVCGLYETCIGQRSDSESIENTLNVRKQYTLYK